MFPVRYMCIYLTLQLAISALSLEVQSTVKDLFTSICQGKLEF